VETAQPAFAASVAAVVAGRPGTEIEAGMTKPVRIYWFLSGR
jgi:hypothetical protein